MGEAIATGKTTPYACALRHVQRRSVLLDPNFQDGKYTEDKKPINGMRVSSLFFQGCFAID